MWQYEPKNSFQGALCAPEGGTGLNTAHSRVRKVLFLVAVLALTMLVTTGAFALTDASDIAFSMSVDPSSLKAPGEITVKVNIENKGSEDITVPMTLYDADNKLLTAAFDGGSLARLSAGESQSWEGKWKVSQEHLDAGRIAFNLRLNTVDATGAITQVSLEAFANIQFQGEKVALEVSREITPEVIRPNGTLLVTYSLKNTGTVKLVDIKVKENNLIATAPQTVASLEPGGTASLKFSKKVANAGVESSAIIEYKQEGSKTVLREPVALVKVPLAKPGFSATLTADSTAITIGETVKLTLTLKNVGNISYSNIQVTDPKLGTVFSDLSLPAGEELSLSKDITLMAPTSYKFSIALEDNSGVKQTESTNEVKVSAYEAGQVMRLNVQITPDRLTVDQLPGLVSFDILITNDSNYVAKPINVYAGESDFRVASHGELKPGESITITRDFNISQAGRYAFSVRTVDALDVTQSFTSNEVSIGFTPPTAAPTQLVKPTIAPVVTFSPVPAQGNQTPAGRAGNALMIVLVAVGVLLAATLLLFLASSFARLRARRQSENAYDHLDVVQKRDYADPSTYQGDTQAPTVAQAAPEGEAVSAPQELPHEKYLQEDQPAPTGDAPQDAEADQDEGEGYSLTRDEDDQAEAAEPRSRRAAKHQRTREDEE